MAKKEKNHTLAKSSWRNFFISITIIILSQILDYPSNVFTVATFIILGITVLVFILFGMCESETSDVEPKYYKIIFGFTLTPILLICAITSLFLLKPLNSDPIVVYSNNTPQEVSLIEGISLFNPFKESVIKYQLTDSVYIDTTGIYVGYAFNGTPVEFHKRYNWQPGGQNVFHSTAKTAIEKIITQSKKDCQGQPFYEQIYYLAELLKITNLPSDLIINKIDKFPYTALSDTVSIIRTQAVL